MHNDEHKEEKLPLFTRLNDLIDTGFQRTGEFIANAAQDKPGIGDDIVRGGLQGLSFIGNLPVIKQIGQLEDKLVDTVGDVAENQSIVDPRSFRYATRVGTMFIPYAGAAKVLSKGKKASKVAKAVDFVDDATFDAQRLKSGLKMRLLNSIDDTSNSKFVPPTPQEIYKTKQELLNNNLADGSGKLNIWNYFSNKKGRSDWGRLMAKKVQTLPHTKESWARIKGELQNDFLSIYPESFLKTIKVNGKPLTKSSIEVEHIFTLQQSMPIFADVEWGGELWNKISKQVISKRFGLGDTRQNLIAVPEHIHRIKTQYFNKMAGIDGRKFFTDDIIKKMIADPKYREQMITEWLKEVAKGKKIIDDGLTIWETLYGGKNIPNMPEELVERLANIDLDTADIKKVIPQIFEEFKKEGFTNEGLVIADKIAEKVATRNQLINANINQIPKTLKKMNKQFNKRNPMFTRWDSLEDALEYAEKELRYQFTDEVTGQFKFYNKSGLTFKDAVRIYGNLLYENNK
jgi:hypothetical protein|tara:strand:- start:359 stop:1903 length:1545 start_codon:yes stop_codon:yes gene_type:complete